MRMGQRGVFIYECMVMGKFRYEKGGGVWGGVCGGLGVWVIFRCRGRGEVVTRHDGSWRHIHDHQAHTHQRNHHQRPHHLINGGINGAASEGGTSHREGKGCGLILIRCIVSYSYVDYDQESMNVPVIHYSSNIHSFIH